MDSKEVSDDENLKKEDLEQRHYALFTELKNMSRDLPQATQQRMPYELLSSLANSLLDQTVFHIVKGLKDIQQMMEKNLFEKRMELISSHKAVREKMLRKHKEKLTNEALLHPENVAKFKALQDKEVEELDKWHDEEINRLDMKIILELDQLVSDQQVTLEKVGVPGFFVSNKPTDIKIQMHLLEFISILGYKNGIE